MKGSLVVASLVAAAVGCVMAIGCAPDPFRGPSPGAAMAQLPNPVVVPPCQPETVWENVVDVVDDYFRIASEEPTRQIEGVLTDGSLSTYPQVGSTLLEPWHHDSANTYERLESTLQTIRRHAVVRVHPVASGYEVEVAVYKELEDLAAPAGASAGAATFRYDDSLTRVVNPVEEVAVEAGWVPMGRDLALEQRILGQLLARTGSAIGR